LIRLRLLRLTKYPYLRVQKSSYPRWAVCNTNINDKGR
jgi:hypothetical protein